MSGCPGVGRRALERAIARRFAVAAWGLALFAVLAFAAACGGDNGEPATPVVEEPTATTVPFPRVDTDVSLVEFHSIGRGYSVGYPQGWEMDANPEATGSGTDSFLWQVSERRIALLQVTCNPRLLSPEALMQADAAIAAQFGPGFDPAAAEPVEVAGVEGLQNTYRIAVGGAQVEHVVAYIAQGECGWRIGLSTFGSGTRESFLSLFERILASFQLT